MMPEETAIRIFKKHSTLLSPSLSMGALVGYKSFLAATTDVLNEASEIREKNLDSVKSDSGIPHAGIAPERSEKNEGIPFELTEAYSNLCAPSADEQGVCLSVLSDWQPLQEALSEGLLSSADIERSLLFRSCRHVYSNMSISMVYSCFRFILSGEDSASIYSEVYVECCYCLCINSLSVHILTSAS